MRILTVLHELQKWEDIRSKIIVHIKDDIQISEKKVRKMDVKKINKQINYYDALSKDMKKDYRPSTMVEFLHTLTGHYYM
jgi:hypothetical protein